MLDFSDHIQNSKFLDLVNKKVIGKMKDELKGKIISEFVGLKSKMYSLIDADNEKKKKQKESAKILSKHNDKRYILNDGINGLPYCHKDILTK